MNGLSAVTRWRAAGAAAGRRSGRVRSAAATLALTVISAGAVAPLAAQPFPPATLDAEIERAMAALGVPGLALAIVRDDSVVYAKGFGVRELGRPGRVDARTLFAIGSSSKAFTAATVGVLVDDGRARWDDPVQQHLPGFRLYDPHVSREITLRDLLSHRSGLGRRGDAIWYGTDATRRQVLERIAQLPPATGFRAAFGYQNAMFLAAGEAVGAAMNTTWDDVVRRRIFAPLGMRDANTSIRELPAAGNVATPHAELDGAVRAVAWRSLDNVAPAGSINAHVTDMAQWLRMLLNAGRYRGRQVLSDTVVREMLLPATVMPVAPAEAARTGTHFRSYGLGWVLEDYRGRKVAWHNGGIDGMKAQVALMPQERLGVVVLANLNGTNIVEALGYRVFDLWLRADGPDWVDALVAQTEAARGGQRAAVERAEAARVRETRMSHPPAAYAGTYRSRVYGDLIVSETAGGLAVRRPGSFDGRLEHWHYDTFRIVWSDPMAGAVPVTFEFDATGRATAVDAAAAGLDRFERVGR